MSIVLQSSGGGSVTLQEAVTASNLTITVPAVTGTMLTTASAGTVLQVVSTAKTDTFTTTSTSLVDITGLSVSITPTSANSKILVFAMVNIGTASTNFGYISLLRNSNQIFIGDASTDRALTTAMSFIGAVNEGAIQAIPITFLDSPSSTSAQTYKIQIRNATSGTVTVNRSFRDSASTNFDMRVPSSITVMEIAA
jgi:hypothetical protein